VLKIKKTGKGRKSALSDKRIREMLSLKSGESMNISLPEEIPMRGYARKYGHKINIKTMPDNSNILFKL
jgi:hypothetical protein